MYTAPVPPQPDPPRPVKKGDPRVCPQLVLPILLGVGKSNSLLYRVYNHQLAGLLWQQKDKFFSRWKERYFVLTEDNLQCFKKESSSRISDMGPFCSRLKLADIQSVSGELHAGFTHG